MYGICISYVYLCMIQIRHILMYTHICNSVYMYVYSFCGFGFLQSTFAYNCIPFCSLNIPFIDLNKFFIKVFSKKCVFISHKSDSGFILLSFIELRWCFCVIRLHNPR